MKNLLISASTLALGLGLATPLLAEPDCVPGYGGCSATGTIPGAPPTDGQPLFDRGEPDTTGVAPAGPVAPAPDPVAPADDCGDGCGDDSAAGSGGDTVFLTLADLQDLGLV